MELPPSIGLYGTIARDPGSLELSGGVAPAPAEAVPGIPYETNAYLPVSPWRAPTEQELSALVLNERPANPSGIISLLRTPDSIMEPFRRLGVANVKSRREFNQLIGGPEGIAAVGNATAWVESFASGSLTVLRIFNEPGLPTTAFNPHVNRFVGLHVDSRDQKAADQRQDVTNRISINLGSEDRYLVYVNLSMEDLVAAVDAAPGSDPNRVVLEFFRAYPTYPVVKARIRPGEAYIAPTENIIHDGIGARTTSDLNLTICGRIGLPREV